MADLQTIPTAPTSSVGLAAVSRAVVSVAAELVTGVQKAVVGPANVRTARDNAWTAILADRARNQARADVSRAVAAQLAARPTATASGRTRTAMANTH